MTEQRRSLELPAGYRSPLVALVVASLDDQSARLSEATRGLSAGDLEHQPAPGMNTIGMLLAHIAIVEVFWARVGFLGDPDPHVDSVLGLHRDDDGMPLPPDGRPPAALAGKGLEFFDGLQARAREELKRHASGISDGDLSREIRRVRADGTRWVYSLRWVLYHILEHESGHFGQVLLLRHLARVPLRA